MSRSFPALRGIAIFIVVLNHSITLALESAETAGITPPSGFEEVLLIALRSLGIIAVPTFLFLSGGFIVFAVRGKTLKKAYRTIASSLKHIMAPYLIWSIIFYLLIYFLNGTLFTPMEYLKYLLVGYPLNFIPILVFFYLVSPVLVRIAQRYAWQLLILVFLYQLFSIVVLRQGVFQLDLPKWIRLLTIPGLRLPEWTRLLTIPGLRLSIAIWGIFFPLGVVCGFHSERFSYRIYKVRWVLIPAALAGYILLILQELDIVAAPIAGLVTPIFVVLLYPLIEREQIPAVRSLEQLGRRAYGLYLSNLIWISLALVLIRALMPGLLQHILLLVPVLMGITIGAVWFTMAGLERVSVRGLRRIVFG
jgi:hypothetical protein